LLALEHVRAEDPGLARSQARVNPFWKVVNSGCNLNRPTRRNIEAAGLPSNRSMNTWRHAFQSRWSARGWSWSRGRRKATPPRWTGRPALSSRSRPDVTACRQLHHAAKSHQSVTPTGPTLRG
jgi:hypothetical protein